MFRLRVISALLIVGLVSACGSTATPAPSSVANANAPTAVLTSAAPPSASPSPTATIAPTSTPSPTATPTPTPAPTPVPWKTYTSKRFHYKMSYPPDWIVTPGSATLSDSYDNFGYPYVYVDRVTVANGISVSATVTAEIAYNKSHYKAKLLSNVGITLAGWPGRLLTFSGVDDSVKVIIKELIVGKGNVGYFIEMFGETANAVADRTLFRKMYLTWRATA